MEIRFNPIHVNSVQAFVSIHSRSTSVQRQVYFARTDGGGSELLTDISNADRIMSAAEHTAYSRLVRLANLSDPDKVNSYVAMYNDFRNGKDIIFDQHPECSAEITDALRTLLSRLHSVNPEITETVERNMAIQLLYRTEQHLIALLVQRKDKFCKLIYSGCTKTSEFLFGYLATMLGIDTLILMPEGKGSIPDKLMENCIVIPYGKHEKMEFPVYKPVAKAEKPVTAQKKPEKLPTPPPVKIRIPQHSERSSAVISDLVHKAAPAQTEAPKERSYEELAALAQSVVMIIILDESGTPVASGSGIAVHPDGYILTNCHVIREGHSFCVRIENDDNIYDSVELIKYHPVFDLALIRIQKKMPPLPIYNDRRQLRRGEKVFAIGSPMGLFNSVSDGIISGFRTIKDREMIQFTAPISHGSSGGALLNCCGEVIGICTGGIDDGQNLNLAVSYQHIRSFASNILK